MDVKNAENIYRQTRHSQQMTAIICARTALRNGGLRSKRSMKGMNHDSQTTA